MRGAQQSLVRLFEHQILLCGIVERFSKVEGPVLEGLLKNARLLSS